MAGRDTSPEALLRQRDAFRRLPPGERLWAAAEMSEAIRDLAKAGIRQRRPGISHEEVQATLVRLLLGPGATAVAGQSGDRPAGLDRQ